MVFVPEDEFRDSLTLTYYTGADYLDFDGVERFLGEDFGLSSHGTVQELSGLFERLRGLRGNAFFNELEAILERADSGVVRRSLRILAFLSSVPAGEDILPLLTSKGVVKSFDLRPLKHRHTQLSSEQVKQYVSLLRELSVDRLVGRQDFRFFPVLMAVKAGSEGNLRKGRSGKLMVSRCNHEMRRFVDSTRNQWEDIQYMPEGEGRLTIADGLGPDKVARWLESIDEPTVRQETEREIEKVIDGLLTVHDSRSTLQIFCEFNGYFSSGGSKPSEIRRAYRYLSDYVPRGAAFLWVTDGRLFLTPQTGSLNSLGKDLVSFNTHRPWAMVLTPNLLEKYLPAFVQENLERM